MNKSPLLMIIAGEVSGDMHAAGLVQAIGTRLPEARFFGIGGEEMRRAGVEIIYDVKDMAVIGFTEVFRRFGFFKGVFKEMLAMARNRGPDAVILVDYPGFNLRFAAKVHALGLKTIYYICPQVWAWRRSRIPKMAGVVDRLITIFPFERKYFEGTGLKVDFVGHPLVDESQKARNESPVDLPWNGEPRVALLPGSRAHEIEHILPIMWRAAAATEKNHSGAGFIIAVPSGEIEDIVRQKIADLSNNPKSEIRNPKSEIGTPSRCSIVTGKTRQVLRQARSAMIASGTATLEASLVLCPMVITYRMAALTYLLGKMLVKIDNIGMVNIVAEKQICPEFIQGKATAEAIAKAIDPLLKDSPERSQMIEELKKANSTLGPGAAEEKAAEIVLAELKL